LHKQTKFRKDSSNRCGDIAIFVIFKMAAAAILDFQKFDILTADPLYGAHASSCQISSKSGERLQRNGDLTVFSKWRPSAILDFLGAYWDHTRRPLDGLYRYVKFG